MPANYVLGKDGKLYMGLYGGRLFTAVGDSPDYSTPDLIMATLVENTDFAIYTNCQDVTLSLDTEEEDITSRASSGFRQTIATIKNSTIEFTAVWKPSDTYFGWLKSAWINSDEIFIMAMDGAWDTAGNSGLVGNFTVPGFSREEPISGVMTSSVTLKGSSYVTWYVDS